jgi:hypothetical protein
VPGVRPPEHQPDLDATEDIGRLTVSLDAAVGMVMDGTIAHAPSCVLT